MRRRWLVFSEKEGIQDEFVRTLNVSPVLAHVLANRGIRDVKSANAFLSPQLTHLSDPMQIPGIEECSEKLMAAVRAGKKIFIYGDYDVDGAASTAMLVECVRLAGGDADYYIPERIDEGYGLHAPALEEIKARGGEIVVTVDCGISAVEEARRARELGISLIITDHHVPGPEVPEADVVVNPKLSGTDAPCHKLAGVGIAFKLAWAIGQTFSANKKVDPAFREFLLDSVGLAALGTIADVVPLQGENRVLAKFGLQALQYSERPGIRALVRCTRMEGKELDAYDVAFRLAPRLNAAGRMDRAHSVVELLTTKDEGKAWEIASDLDRLNRERQAVQRSILAEARERILQACDPGAPCALVASGEGWHQGVVGIVASKIAEEFHRPTILISTDGEIGHGSGRSIAGFDLFAALRACAEHLIQFGGHEQAAGLQMRKDKIPELKARLDQIVAETLSAAELIPALHIDVVVGLEQVSESLVGELDRAGPFGQGNPAPLLAARGTNVGGTVKRIGSQGQHLTFYVRQNSSAFRAVAFGMGERYDELVEGVKGSVDIAFVPFINEWRGNRNVELQIEDFRVE